MGYWQRSPLSLVGNVKTPTLVVVGSEDYRTPDSEAEQYYTALQLRGVPDRVRQGARREPRRHCFAPEPGGGKGQRNPRLVQPLPDRYRGSDRRRHRRGFPAGRALTSCDERRFSWDRLPGGSRALARTGERR